MRTEQVTLTIFGYSEEVFQHVRVAYTIETRQYLYAPGWYVITQCRLLDEIEIIPSDFETDIIEGIRFAEGLPLGLHLELDCKIENKFKPQTIPV